MSLVLHRQILTGSGLAQVDGFGAAGLGLDIELHFLAFGKGAHAGAFNIGDMNEDVFGSILRRDKAKALGLIEEFNGTDSHSFDSPICVYFPPVHCVPVE